MVLQYFLKELYLVILIFFLADSRPVVLNLITASSFCPGPAERVLRGKICPYNNIRVANSPSFYWISLRFLCTLPLPFRDVLNGACDFCLARCDWKFNWLFVYFFLLCTLYVCIVCRYCETRNYTTVISVSSVAVATSQFSKFQGNVSFVWM